jgi:hypothetical protein
VHLKLDGNQYGITIFRHPQQEEEKGNKAGLMKTMAMVDILFVVRDKKHLIAMWRS